MLIFIVCLGIETLSLLKMVSGSCHISRNVFIIVKPCTHLTSSICYIHSIVVMQLKVYFI